MKKLILVCGPAAIGKSTFSAKYAREHPEEEVVVIAADEVRKEMYGGYDQFPPGMNMMVIYEEMVKRARRLCEAKDSLTLIFDTTMLYDERRLYFQRHLPDFDRYILILLKLHDYTKCLQRNHQRPKEKWVPDHIILDMASHYEDPSEECKKHFDFVGEIYVD